MRTLLILDEGSGKLLYGHAISWAHSELDYTVKNWKSFKIKGLSVFFKDVEDEDLIRSSLKLGKFEIPFPGSPTATFNLPEVEEFFIEKSYEEDNFNPFIGLCTYAEVHFSDADPSADFSPMDYALSNKEALEVIQEKYRVDLIKFPHLIGTFTIFTPTSIEENFKGIEDDQTVGYEIALYDYFSLYNGAQVTLESVSDKEAHKTTLHLDNNLHKVNCGFVPDKHITHIELDGKTIYRSSFSLLKRISVQANIIEEKRVAVGDKVIRLKTSTRSNFDV
jgi:hypothetical protein